MRSRLTAWRNQGAEANYTASRMAPPGISRTLPAIHEGISEAQGLLAPTLE